MNIFDYTTAGGKNLITGFLDDLPKKGQAEGYRIRSVILADGISALQNLKKTEKQSRNQGLANGFKPCERMRLESVALSKGGGCNAKGYRYAFRP